MCMLTHESMQHMQKHVLLRLDSVPSISGYHNKNPALLIEVAMLLTSTNVLGLAGLLL